MFYLFPLLQLTFECTGNKVEWFRARIDLKQWREEVETLNEELTRTAKWFDCMSSLWRSLAARASKQGYAEYAHQKASMFSRRARNAELWHTWALNAELEKEVKEKSILIGKLRQEGALSSLCAVLDHHQRAHRSCHHERTLNGSSSSIKTNFQ